MVLRGHKMVLRIAFHKVSCHPTRDLECFADSNSIPWNAPTIVHPEQIATVLQKSLPSFCAPLSQQSHLFLNGAVLPYNDSRITLHKLCQFLGDCQSKRLLVSSSAPRTFVSSFAFPVKFLFYMGIIVSTVLTSHVPLQRNDDCCEIHVVR